eukprot:m.857447 g.857447  ORF g.857447 m.857447 type:complete len:110 (+) comp59648_c0_seq9:497-826(+)
MDGLLSSVGAGVCVGVGAGLGGGADGGAGRARAIVGDVVVVGGAVVGLLLLLVVQEMSSAQMTTAALTAGESAQPFTSTAQQHDERQDVQQPPLVMDLSLTALDLVLPE